MRSTNFQYPLSDRTRCNSLPKDEAGEIMATFSILYRIELAVTVSLEGLQVYAYELSVSSIGSKSL